MILSVCFANALKNSLKIEAHKLKERERASKRREHFENEKQIIMKDCYTVSWNSNCFLEI